MVDPSNLGFPQILFLVVLKEKCHRRRMIHATYQPFAVQTIESQHKVVKIASIIFTADFLFKFSTVSLLKEPFSPSKVSIFTSTHFTVTILPTKLISIYQETLEKQKGQVLVKDETKKENCKNQMAGNLLEFILKENRIRSIYEFHSSY